MVSAKSKTSGKSSNSDIRSCWLSTRLCAFLHGSKNVSPTASTLVMAGPSSERDVRLPEQRINVSLFGPSNVQPQTVCDNVFRASGDAPLQDSHSQHGGSVCRGRIPDGPIVSRQSSSQSRTP